MTGWDGVSDMHRWQTACKSLLRQEKPTELSASARLSNARNPRMSQTICWHSGGEPWREEKEAVNVGWAAICIPDMAAQLSVSSPLSLPT